jgi:hypothetical protein
MLPVLRERPAVLCVSGAVPILYLARKYMMFRYNYESFSEKTHPW